MHTTHKTLAQTAISAGLGIALAIGAACAPATVARADEGSVTITQQHNAQASYDAYLLFKADISNDNKATHISWASDSMRKVVLAFLDANNYKLWLQGNHPGEDQHDRAQNAAEFIFAQIADSASDMDAATTPRTTQGRSFANRLAQALARDHATPKQVAPANVSFTGAEGYWLFVTTDATTEASGEAGTAPIWIPLGGAHKEVTEKSAVPTIAKEVQEDATESWGAVADAHVGQDLAYRLTATLPTNFGAFDAYHLVFDDTLSQGLELAQGSQLADALAIKVGEREVKVDGSNVKASYKDRHLSVEFADLKATFWDSYAIKASTAVTVSYHAHLTADAAVGVPGNANGASLTYTDDPVSGQDGHIDPGPSTRAFAYQLSLRKLDEQTGEALAGAAFSIQVADNNSDAASRGLYVQADGSLGTQPATFVTDAMGCFTVSGIDEGSYRIRETKAPDGYESLDDDISLTVSSELDAPGLTITSLSAKVSGGDEKDVNAVADATVATVDTQTGSVSLEVTNDRWLDLPITGEAGLGISALVGACLTAAAGSGLWLRRRASAR